MPIREHDIALQSDQGGLVGACWREALLMGRGRLTWTRANGEIAGLLTVERAPVSMRVVVARRTLDDGTGIGLGLRLARSQGSPRRPSLAGGHGSPRLLLNVASTCAIKGWASSLCATARLLYP
ncbi:hypothetical protein PR202_ga00579 [Eleusine coracana subsp. coracana]|uniref:Uncharacterized protein n=1 Tax=Eleusine coracana subsp. coracana TaxID=191504 RepID=A0AAV5BE68_ELECO|nr:hypothetical protein PR202_ga00579 [Eleusine coracana subsp. coracana]